MTSTDDLGAPPNPSGSNPSGFWKSDGRNLVIGVLASLIATAITFAILAFFKVKLTTGAFQALLACALITTIVAIACLFILVLQHKKKTSIGTTMHGQFGQLSAGIERQFRQFDRGLDKHLAELKSSIARIDWSYDAKEPDSHIYERMQRLIDDSRIREFKVLTIFRDAQRRDYGDEQRKAIE